MATATGNHGDGGVGGEGRHPSSDRPLSSGLAPPHSANAERGLVKALIENPVLIPDAVAAGIDPEQFFLDDMRYVFEGVVEAYYSDEKIDPVTVGDMLRKPLSVHWNVTEQEVPQALRFRMMRIEAATDREAVVSYTGMVKRHANSRQLLALMSEATMKIGQGDDPDEVADVLAEGASRVMFDKDREAEIKTFADVGRDYIRYLRKLKAAREQGVELAAYFGYDFLDAWLHGLYPTELLVCGGEPGVGKSSVWWKAGEEFAIRQMKQDEDKRIGCLILSLEMGEEPSAHRLAQSLTDISGAKLRSGGTDDSDIIHITREWKKQMDIPLYFNFASSLKASQIRALVIEGIRRFNIGVVIIDHFRQFNLDRRWYSNPNMEDEEKVRFLKERIAKDLNLAVVCLAHTVKPKRDDGRPNMHDLRGSGMVSAVADQVCFVYRPYDYANAEDRDNAVFRTDAELIWSKNRHGNTGTAEFVFEPSNMHIQDPN